MDPESKVTATVILRTPQDYVLFADFLKLLSTGVAPSALLPTTVGFSIDKVKDTGPDTSSIKGSESEDDIKSDAPDREVLSRTDTVKATEKATRIKRNKPMQQPEPEYETEADKTAPEEPIETFPVHFSDGSQKGIYDTPVNFLKALGEEAMTAKTVDELTDIMQANFNAYSNIAPPLQAKFKDFHQKKMTELKAAAAKEAQAAKDEAQAAKPAKSEDEALWDALNGEDDSEVSGEETDDTPKTLEDCQEIIKEMTKAPGMTINSTIAFITTNFKVKAIRELDPSLFGEFYTQARRLINEKKALAD